MPKKIRELKNMLKKAGFSQTKGKGSHTNWIHPLYSGKITISGKDGADAKPYQESEVGEAIAIIKIKEKQQKNQDNE